VLVGILTVGILKNVIVFYILNSIFKPICICLQETGKSKYLPKDVSSPLIPYYNSVYDQTEVLLIKPRFELHFMVFLIINLLFFLAIKFSPMAL